MRVSTFPALIAFACLAHGCSTTVADERSADNPQSPAAAPGADAPPATSAATRPNKGAILYLRCRSCHTLERDGVHLVGPNLNGFMGAAAGSKEGYAFSDALAESGIVWSEETLDRWLENPGTLVPGNRMVFAGLPDEADRLALIAYLTEQTR